MPQRDQKKKQEAGKTTKNMKSKPHIGLALAVLWAYVGAGAAGASAGPQEDAQSCARKKGTQAEQIQICTRAIDSRVFFGRDLAQLVMRRGVLYSLLGNNPAAMSDYSVAISLLPAEARFWLQRGIVKAGAGDHERAIPDFDEALRLKPANPTALYFRGHSHAALGQTEQALEDYDRALELKPDFPSALVFRGVLLERLGSPTRAVADYTAAYKLGARARELLTRLRAYEVIK